MPRSDDENQEQQQLETQARQIEELRELAGRIQSAQERSNVLRVLDELEQIRARHSESQRQLAEGRRRTKIRAVILGALAAVWLAVMVYYAA